VQIGFGIEGAALATSSDGPAAECLEKLGGLTIGQLRWMFSSLTENLLIQEYDGWNSSEVPHSDGNELTRRWSELHNECQPEEILIIGMASSNPVHDFFEKKISHAAEEVIDTTRFHGETDIEVLVDKLERSKSGIGFFNIRYALSEEDKSVVANRLKTVLLLDRNRAYISPEDARFEDRDYPLTSHIYFNINDEQLTWINLRPFLEYAFSEQGTSELLEASFWPVPRWKQEVMKARAQTATAVAMEDIVCGPDGSDISIAGSTTVFPVSQICELQIGIVFKLTRCFRAFNIRA
jgi:ABC-type phosphate transport system substrate-binding protein